ncbi:hypothetical protein F7734_33515 [Scytonema sp. UIC 10036]|uniref:hypothetical protein n=1 Tax=Scytonema sp. UIC 10036 TaxID=2304196 RepID=UPI0012DAE14A|nr:hypothetical protein [Scytonema sp. UIC 10036]MUG96992.1 hypothetical protein [Scytonema sp. UIC 10036]
MEYLITPPEETDWQINQSDFANCLLKKWSNIQLKQITNPDDYYCLEGSISVAGDGQMLEVALHRDRQGVSLDGYLEDCAFFAVWLRSLVTQNQKLVFYDQGYNVHIELKQNTTKSEIINSFISTPQPLL